jgi:hypothetical protein
MKETTIVGARRSASIVPFGISLSQTATAKSEAEKKKKRKEKKKEHAQRSDM